MFKHVVSANNDKFVVQIHFPNIKFAYLLFSKLTKLFFEKIAYL